MVYTMSAQEEIPGLELPPRPEAPHHGECCGRGCERCVYVCYEEAIQRWEERVASLKAEHQAAQHAGSRQPHE